MRSRFAILTAAAAVSLGGCAYGMYGDGFGYGYGPYSGVSVGYGVSYGDYGYGYPGGYGYPYGGFGYGGYSPFGWYDNYYYPGTGVYVYDSYRRPHRWSDSQRRYWSSRRDQWRDRNRDRTSSVTVRPNWSGFDRTRASSSTRTAREQRQRAREERQQQRNDRRRDRD